jgi:hypothetical protein
MALWCRRFMRVLILVSRTFRSVNFLMACSCMAPLTHVVMVQHKINIVLSRVGKLAHTKP